MGNYLSNDFYIYGRKKDTDKYDLLCELKEGTPMSRFKHEVYAYALKKRYKDMKSLYLYCGYSRVAKAIMSRENEISNCTVSCFHSAVICTELYD